MDWCAEIVPLFGAAGIPVIRLGLNPTDELSGGAAAGGAYHPALGELVKSRIMLKRAQTLLGGIEENSMVEIVVGRGKTSQMLGQKRYNYESLMRDFHLKSLKVCEREEKDDEIEIRIV